MTGVLLAIIITATVPLDAAHVWIAAMLRAAAREAGCSTPLVEMRATNGSSMEITIRCKETP